MIRGLATLILLLCAAGTYAGQVTPLSEEGHVGLVLESTTYPDTLGKDLTSGLTNRILIRVTLARDSTIVRQRAVEITIRYDLWDEHFEVLVNIDGEDNDARIMRSITEVRSFLRRLRLPRLFRIDSLASAQPFTLTADVLLNPVDRERMEMIRKWVTENSIGPGDVTGRQHSDLAIVIFNRIFEQYSSGADVASVWQETSTSRSFRLEDLAHESR